MAYEIWDTESRNLQGTYDTEAAALAVVARAIAEHGEPYAESLLLGYEDSSGRSRLIAVGRDLVDRALGDARQPVGSGVAEHGS